MRLRAMPHTAWATTATATILRPWIAAPARRPVKEVESSANSKSSKAEGKVKPSQAARPVERPRRDRPSAKPTWLLAGPGRNWHSATRSA